MPCKIITLREILLEASSTGCLFLDLLSGLSFSTVTSPLDGQLPSDKGGQTGFNSTLKFKRQK